MLRKPTAGWNVRTGVAILAYMQHIGIDARLTYYRIGGISTYIRRLILALEALDTDYQYTIFNSRKSNSVLSRRFPQARLWTPCHHRLEPVALSAELLRFNLDLLHSPDFIPPLCGAHHHIITIHDLNFLHYPQFLTPESRRYYNHQINRAVRQADHILADSEATKRDLIEMLTVPAEKITVHMLGVDESFQPLSPDALHPVRHNLDLPADYILFLGTFEPRKNVRGLLDAYRLLLDMLPDAPPLVLAGTRGWLFDETMAHVNTLNLSSRVLWRENISQNDLPALYNMAAVLVMPSFYEGFGFPALEAMACGTVPIVSNRSSLPEVVGNVGLQIDPDDPSALALALQHTLSDQEWRSAMRRAGLARAATFTWERTAQIALSAYQQLLN